MGNECFGIDDMIRIASSLAAEAVQLLPQEEGRAAAEAFQAVLLSHAGEWEASDRKLKMLRKLTGSDEPGMHLLRAHNSVKRMEGLASSDREAIRCRDSARRSLSRYISSDISSRPEKEKAAAMLLKARLDYAAGRRKGVFMGLLELPHDAAPDAEGLLLDGCTMLSISDDSAIFSAGKGNTLIEASISSVKAGDGPLILLTVYAADGDARTASMRFIEAAASFMERFPSSSLYIGGTILTLSDAEEALADIDSGAFPIWFFARGIEMDDGSGSLAVCATGAESFGVREIRIEGLDGRSKEEALSALSVILVFMVFSASLRKAASFEIGGRRYVLSSSSPERISYRMEE